VLAFDAAGGETAMEDVPLGQVRKIFFSFFLPPRFSLFSPPSTHSLAHLPFSSSPPPKKKTPLHSHSSSAPASSPARGPSSGG